MEYYLVRVDEYLACKEKVDKALSSQEKDQQISTLVNEESFHRCTIIATDDQLAHVKNERVISLKEEEELLAKLQQIRQVRPMIDEKIEMLEKKVQRV